MSLNLITSNTRFVLPAVKLKKLKKKKLLFFFFGLLIQLHTNWTIVKVVCTLRVMKFGTEGGSATIGHLDG